MWSHSNLTTNWTPLETDSLLNTHHICLASFSLEHARIHTYILIFFSLIRRAWHSVCGMLAKNVCSQTCVSAQFPLQHVASKCFLHVFFVHAEHSTAQHFVVVIVVIVLIFNVESHTAVWPSVHQAAFGSLYVYECMLFLCLLCVNIFRNFVSIFLFVFLHCCKINFVIESLMVFFISLKFNKRQRVCVVFFLKCHMQDYHSQFWASIYNTMHFMFG